MILAYKIIGISILIPSAIWVALFMIKFPKKMEKFPEQDNMESERARSRSFYKNIFVFLLVTLDFSIISVSAFVLNIYFGGEIPFYAAPVIILCVFTLCFTVFFDIGFGKIAVKNKIKNYDPFTRELSPVSMLGDKGLLGIGLFIGLCLAEIFACAVYMIMLLI